MSPLDVFIVEAGLNDLGQKLWAESASIKRLVAMDKHRQRLDEQYGPHRQDYNLNESNEN